MNANLLDSNVSLSDVMARHGQLLVDPNFSDSSLDHSLRLIEGSHILSGREKISEKIVKGNLLELLTNCPLEVSTAIEDMLLFDVHGIDEFLKAHLEENLRNYPTRLEVLREMASRENYISAGTYLTDVQNAPSYASLMANCPFSQQLDKSYALDHPLYPSHYLHLLRLSVRDYTARTTKKVGLFVKKNVSVELEVSEKHKVLFRMHLLKRMLDAEPLDWKLDLPFRVLTVIAIYLHGDIGRAYLKKLNEGGNTIANEMRLAALELSAAGHDVSFMLPNLKRS